MPINVANVRKIINWVKHDKAEHFRISNFVDYIDPDREDVPEEYKEQNGLVTKYLECNTTFCIAGYANILRWEEKGSSLDTVDDLYSIVTDQSTAKNWMGIDDDTGHNLFFCVNNYLTREEFDDLGNDTKASIVIDVLEHLIETGHVDWNSPILAHVDKNLLGDGGDY